MLISKTENNYSRNISPRQHNVEKDCIPNDFIVQNVENFFNDLDNTKKKVLGYLISLSMKCPFVSPSQTTIARKVGISRQHCNRIIGYFRSVGILTSEFRYKLSCHYYVSSFIFKSDVMQKIGHIFKVFRALSLSLLVSVSNITSDVTQYIKKYNRNLLSFTFTSSYCKSAKTKMSSMEQKFVRKAIPNNPVGDTIRGIKQMKLTRAGQIKLTAFPDEAIRDAVAVLSTAKNVRDPYALVYKMCFEYCKRHQLDPDWHYMFAVMKTYNIDLQDANTTKEKEEEVKEAAPKADKREFKKTYQNSTQAKDNYKSPYKPWQGHTEPPKKHLNISDAKPQIIKGLQLNNSMVITLMKMYPQDVRTAFIELFTPDEICYCDLIKEKCGWDFECPHLQEVVWQKGI